MKCVTLTTRLSLFFLLTLAVVLTGFSLTLYLLAGDYLQRQCDERLAAALNTLTAAAEINPEGLVWDPAERRLNVAPAAFRGETAWTVRDQRGELVDQSSQPDASDLPVAAAGDVRWHNAPWRLRQAWLRAPHEEPSARAPQTQTDEEPKYSALQITAGVTLEPMQSTLRLLAWTLAGLSAGIWLVSLIAGRVVCRRALSPVSSMAAAARETDAEDHQQRLPLASTGDELEDLARAFNGLLDRLQEAYERQRRFTGDASHQLRTPLAALMGQVEVALRRPRATDEYERVLQTVHREAQRLRQIVESLLFLARADGEAALPSRQRLDLAEWLPDHLQQWSEHERFADLAFESSCDGPCDVEAHPIMLGELINILLDNAFKYSPPDTEIAVRLARADGTVCVAVENEGPGIAEADLLRLFTPFFRSDLTRQRKIEGVGLGLSIARRLANSIGGQLAVENEPGKGTCFTLSLACFAPDKSELSLPSR